MFLADNSIDWLVDWLISWWIDGLITFLADFLVEKRYTFWNSVCVWCQRTVQSSSLPHKSPSTASWIWIVGSNTRKNCVKSRKRAASPCGPDWCSASPTPSRHPMSVIWIAKSQCDKRLLDITSKRKRKMGRIFLVHYHLALEYALIRKLDEAFRSVKKCLRINMDFPPAHHLLALLLSCWKRYEEALNVLEKVEVEFEEEMEVELAKIRLQVRACFNGIKLFSSILFDDALFCGLFVVVIFFKQRSTLSSIIWTFVYS